VASRRRHRRALARAKIREPLLSDDRRRRRPSPGPASIENDRTKVQPVSSSGTVYFSLESPEPVMYQLYVRAKRVRQIQLIKKKYNTPYVH
jgi:hypothetical protein